MLHVFIFTVYPNSVYIYSICVQSMEFCQSYENYAYLWVDDRNEFLRQFLIYGHVLTPEEVFLMCCFCCILLYCAQYTAVYGDTHVVL